MRGTVLVADRGRCRAVRQSCPEVGRLTPTEWNIGRRYRREGWRDAERRRKLWTTKLSCWGRHWPAQWEQNTVGRLCALDGRDRGAFPLGCVPGVAPPLGGIDDLALVDGSGDPCSGTRSRHQPADTDRLTSSAVMIVQAGAETISQRHIAATMTPWDVVAWDSTNRKPVHTRPGAHCQKAAC